MSAPPVFTKRDEGQWVEGRGVVRRLLSDDHDGDRHQRFVLDMKNGQTLLVAHNLDIAERVPLGMGDRVRFRGVYEWNELGGLVHWTHRDPLGEIHDAGYIEFRRKRFG